MNIKMSSLFFVLTLSVLSFCTGCFAGTITVGWDPVLENEDDTPFVDLTAYKIFYAPIQVEAASNGIWNVVSTGVWSSVSTVNTQISLVLPSEPYMFYGVAVASLGVESRPSESLVTRVGAPKTIHLRWQSTTK
jgi:hypothetical protein